MPTWLTPAAAKFWVGVVGAVVVAVLSALPDDPQWLVVVSAVLTAVGVYLVPNAAPETVDPAMVSDPGYTEHVDPAAGAPVLDEDQGLLP